MSRDDLASREAAFHDARYSDENRAKAAKYYAADPSFQDCYLHLVDTLAPDHPPLLEIGCGPGAVVLRETLHDVDRTAIDISPVAVRKAASEGSTAQFIEMDAHALDVADLSIGMVCGSGVLHHLDLSAAVPELRRVLREDGVGVFVEPMGHNPLINLYRRLTPSMRTADEHPLRMSDIRSLHGLFAVVDVRWFGLLAPAAALLGRGAIGRAVGRALRRLDRRLLSIGALQRYAWMAVIVVRDPSHGRI